LAAEVVSKAIGGDIYRLYLTCKLILTGNFYKNVWFLSRFFIDFVTVVSTFRVEPANRREAVI
jgi:hypothetical protein